MSTVTFELTVILYIMFLLCWSTLTLCRSGSEVRVVGQVSLSHNENCACLATDAHLELALFRVTCVMFATAFMSSYLACKPQECGSLLSRVSVCVCVCVRVGHNCE